MSNKTYDHNHREIAFHSPLQQRKFFALGQELGHKPEDLKAKAKRKFNVDCFNKLTKSDMMYLIDRLAKQQEVKVTKGIVNGPKQTSMIVDEIDQEALEKMTPEQKTAFHKAQAEKANEEMIKNL